MATLLRRLVLFFLFFKNFWLCWVFVTARGLSLVTADGSYSSLWWLLLLLGTVSRCVGFGSCGMQARRLCCPARPRPGTEPVSPALAGRFLSTGPLGKPSYVYWSSEWAVCFLFSGFLSIFIYFYYKVHQGLMCYVCFPIILKHL